MFLKKLLSNVENFHRRAFADYLGAKLFKLANESLLSEYDNFEFQDQNLFEQSERFVDLYKKVIDAIDSAETAVDVETLENLTDDLGFFSRLGTRYDEVMENPYLQTAENKEYLEEFAPEDLMSLFSKMFADAKERYSNSDVVSDFLYFKETDGGASEIEKDFGDNRNIDKKDFGEGGGMRGGNRTSTYDPVKARQRRMDEKVLKERARKATPEEIEADMSLQRGLRLIQAAAERYARNKADPEWVERNRKASRISSLKRVDKHKSIEENEAYKRSPEVRILEMEKKIKRLQDQLLTADSGSEKEILQKEIKEYEEALKFFKTQHKKHSKPVDAKKISDDELDNPDLLLKKYTKFEDSLNTTRASNRDRLKKLKEFEDLVKVIADAKERGDKQAVRAATAVLNTKLAERKESKDLEVVLAPAFTFRDNIKKLHEVAVKNPSIITNTPPEFIPALEGLVEEGTSVVANLQPFMESKVLSKGNLSSASDIVHYLKQIIGNNKIAYVANARIKNALAVDEVVDDVISQVDALNITNSMQYARKILELLSKHYGLI